MISSSTMHGFVRRAALKLKEIGGWLISFAFVVGLAQLPPGPTPWIPVIGNLLYLTRPRAHRGLRNLAEHYGGLMSLRLGFDQEPCIVVSSAQMAEEIYRHDRIFSSRPTGRVIGLMTCNHKSVSTAPDGKLWRKLRNISHPFLTQQSIARYELCRMEEIGVLIRDLTTAAHAGQCVNLHSMLHDLSSNNMTRMLISRRYFANVANDEMKKRESLDFQEILERRMEHEGKLAIGDFIPWLSFIDFFRGLDRMSQDIQSKTMNFCETIMDIDGRRKAPSNDPARPQDQDFVDFLLSKQAEDPNITDELIKLLFLDMIVAGTDTSSIVTEWALSEMVRHPALLERAQAELDSVVDNDHVTESMVKYQLPYLRAVVNETFRLHPAAPLNLPRISTEECTIAGYNLPARTRLIINQWSIHRDPAVYQNPDVFNPDRFAHVGNDITSIHSNTFFQLLPFGLGRRGCPGLELGWLTVSTLLANLLLRFDWDLPGNQSPQDLDMSEDAGLTAPRKSHLHLIPRIRTPVRN